MAFKRQGGPAEPEGEGEVKLVDELVRKALQVNPDLRQGKDTQQVMKGLREQAKAAIAKRRGQTDSKPPAPQSPADRVEKFRKGASRDATPKSENPLQQTIDIFMGQKAERYPQEAEQYVAKMEAIQKRMQKELDEVEIQLDALRAATVEDIVRLLTPLLASGATPGETQSTLRAYRNLLEMLNVTETELIKKAQGK